MAVQGGKKGLSEEGYRRIDESSTPTTLGMALAFRSPTTNALVVESVFEKLTVMGTKSTFWRGPVGPMATLYPSCLDLFVTERQG